MESLKPNRRLLPLFSVPLLIVMASCIHDPKEKFALNKITVGLYGLCFDESLDKYYPVKYDPKDTNDFFMLGVDFDFEFINDPQNPSDNPYDGINGPVDSILQVDLFGVKLADCDSFLLSPMVIDQRTHYAQLPYDKNDLDCDDDSIFYADLCNINMLKERYNFDPDRSQVPLEYLWQDQFYYIERERLDSFFNSNSVIQLQVKTSLRKILSNEITPFSISRE